ncbi:Wzz/FepE/Etk N-terminal domain-containing protein [Candidatus Pelagibacter sp.]|nr:Wzz/FepE/Etk N-terminal domain-containing protein [Candidatus Pelagibacter sp.]
MEGKSFLHKLESLNEQLNIAHYWIIFLKYKRILFFSPVLFGLLGLFIALNINPTFKSQATLVIEESTKNIVNIEEVYSGDTPRGGFRGSNYINNQIQILESDEVLGSIVRDEMVKVKSEKMYKKLPKNFLLQNKIFSFFIKDEKKFILKKYIKSNLKVSQIRNSDVVNITMTSGNAELAKFLLEKVIEAYLKYDVDTKVRVTNYANAQINLRLSKLLEQMEIAEQKLLNYKKENNLIDIGDIKDLKIDQIKSVSKRIIDANRELQKNKMI